MKRADRDDARHRHCIGMADTQSPLDNAKVGGNSCRAACKPDLRWSSCGALDDDIRECHAGTEPCSQRLQDSFLRGKPAGQALSPIGPIANLVQFFLNKAARDQGIARIFNPASYIGNVD